MNSVFVGIDLGGTNIKVGCFDSELNLLCKVSVATEADMGPAVVVERMTEAIISLVKDAGFKPEDIKAAGIGTPGPADYRKGIIINSTNMPTFKNVPGSTRKADPPTSRLKI